MGADQIYMVFNGNVNDILIKKTMDERAAIEREINGHQDGYSGDWQCVNDFKRVRQVFQSKDEALNYLNENCQKWGPALVVQYLTKDKNQPTIKTVVSAVVPC